MTGLLTASDRLTEAKHLFDAATMALEAQDRVGLTEEEARAAISACLYAGSRCLAIGLDAVEQERLGQKAVRE